MRRAAALAVLLACALPALAGAPDRSPRPQMRVAASAPNPVGAVLAAVLAAPAPAPAEIPSAIPAAASPLGPAISLRPAPRPDGVEVQAMAKRRKQIKGSVCGDVDIQGETVGRVPGKIAACGIEDAVRVRSVSGVTLSPEALINCPTVKALKSWVENGAKPAFRRRGPLVEMTVAASYTCRTRNNQAGARVSEHGKGNAIDISGFKMRDGELVTVLDGWGRGTTLKPLRSAWKAACGPFGTVLGPGSDGYHRDHIHLDTAGYRSGPYCR